MVELAIKHWKWIAMGVLCLALKITIDMLQREEAVVASYEKDHRTIAKIIGSKVTTDAIIAKVTVLKQEHDSAQGALDDIDEDTAVAKDRSDKSDAALRAEQEANERALAAARRRIDELEARTASQEDLSVIRKDSKAPWEGWQ